VLLAVPVGGFHQLAVWAVLDLRIGFRQVEPQGFTEGYDDPDQGNHQGYGLQGICPHQGFDATKPGVIPDKKHKEEGGDHKGN